MPETCLQLYKNYVTNSNKILMERNIPRAAIHVGTDKKSFSSQVGNEAERRGWDEKRYQLKNADIDKNNHYNYSRKRLNFEIVKDGKIVPLGSQSVPLHERLQHRLDELGFKPYMDAKRPDQVSRNSPNCTVGIIFSGDHDVLNRLAFGEQKLNTSDPNADHSKVVLQKASMTGHWTPIALHVRNGEKRMSSALMCIVMRQASMPMCRPCLLNK